VETAQSRPSRVSDTLWAPNDRPVVVFGGTGHYGRHIVDGIRQVGAPVRVFTRDAAGARALLGDGVEFSQGDITDPEAVRSALSGAVAAVFAVSAFHPRLIRRVEEIEGTAVLGALDEAERQGVLRVVYLSVYDIARELGPDLPLSGRIKAMVEDHLLASGLDWTVLGAPPSMDLFFALIRGGRIMVVPGGGPPALPSIAAPDLGRLAARAIVRPDLIGSRIRLTGPEALSFREAAERISRVWGRKIRFQPVPVLPIKAAGWITRPANPFLGRVAEMLSLLNRFPPEVAAQVHEDHIVLQRLLPFRPTTLETEARRRAG